MAASEGKNGLRSARLLIIGLVAVIVVLGLALIVLAISRGASRAEAQRIDVLADSTDECVVCHRRTTPGIVEQFGHSSMAAAEVTCRNCHEVNANYPNAVEHEGTYVLNSPTTARCDQCHVTEVAQYNQSRHGVPAYVAYAGAESLSPDMLEMYKSIPEAAPDPNRMRNSLFALEGPEVTQFACEV